MAAMRASLAAVCGLVILAVTSDSTAVVPVGRHVRSIKDIQLDPTDNVKQVHLLEMQVETKDEEIKQNRLMMQQLSVNLTTALQTVEQLTEKERILNKTVETLSRENKELKEEHAYLNSKVQELMQNYSSHAPEGLTDQQLHIYKSLNYYSRDQNWGDLRRSLEVLLNHSTEAYSQLQAISYGLGYPLWKIGSMCLSSLAEVIASGPQGPNISESDNDTMLHGAAESGCISMATMLLDRGADVNARDNGKATPLIVASRYGQLNMTKLLVERGADVNCTDSNRMTSLHLAAQGGHLEVVKYLVQSSADETAVDKSDKTPLDRAKSRGRNDVTQYLCRNNATLCQSTPVRSQWSQPRWRQLAAMMAGGHA